MATTADERHERLDGPIHGWFSLTYSNYLVLHRSMMQSMPVAWQERAVALFDELDHAFPDLERPPSFIVTPARECDYSDLGAKEMAELGVTCSDDDPEYEGDTVFWDSEGVEHQPFERLLVPIGEDPVPHYNRGRTFIEPADAAEKEQS